MNKKMGVSCTLSSKERKDLSNDSNDSQIGVIWLFEP